MVKIVREEGGYRALYRGLPATAFGIAPYVGINFTAYETLRGIITPPEKTTIVRKLACGALAGSISQSITYPMDVLRRKMQVTGMNNLGVRYNSALEALFVILRQEGPRGLYKGLWPNLRTCFDSCHVRQLTKILHQLKLHRAFPYRMSLPLCACHSAEILTRFFSYETAKEFLLAY